MPIPEEIQKNLTDNQEDFLMMCEGLHTAIVRPLLREENREDTLRDFGTLGRDILTRWSREYRQIVPETPTE